MIVEPNDWYTPVVIEDVHKTTEGVYMVMVQGIWLEVGFEPPIAAYANDDKIMIVTEIDCDPDATLEVIDRPCD